MLLSFKIKWKSIDQFSWIRSYFSTDTFGVFIRHVIVLWGPLYMVSITEIRGLYLVNYRKFNSFKYEDYLI